MTKQAPREKYLVSMCMAGSNCRYDGSNKFSEIIAKLIDEGRAFPLCPELLGGLPTPREVAECRYVGSELRVFTKTDVDVTDAFLKGARAVLDFAKKHHVTKAILYHNSPSCGKRTYDGSFSGRLADYSGVTAKLLQENGIEIISSDELAELETEL